MREYLIGTSNKIKEFIDALSINIPLNKARNISFHIPVDDIATLRVEYLLTKEDGEELKELFKSINIKTEKVIKVK